MIRGGLMGSGLVSVLALLFVLRGSSPTPVTQTPNARSQPTAVSQSQDQTETSTLAMQEVPWKASREHFAGITKCGAPVGDSAKQSSAAKQQSAASHNVRSNDSLIALRRTRWCIPDATSAQAMIAVVSDPGRSRVPLFFDHALEAIELASESLNYVFDRYWFPWQIDAKDQFSDYLSQVNALKDEQERQKLPGLMLFRWNGDKGEKKPTVLYVFLVGDSAAAGINGSQFSLAVDYVKEICSLNPDGSGCGPDDVIRIMGPTFSGSLNSLLRLTEVRDADKFVAYSGTVSSECAQENLHLLPRVTSSPCPESHSANDTTSKNLAFRSLVNSSEFSVQRFLAFLQGKHHISCDGLPEVAILSEAATTYGSSARRTIATQT